MRITISPKSAQFICLTVLWINTSVLSGQNCDVDFPGSADLNFSTSCGGPSIDNLTLGLSNYMGANDSFTFDAPATITINGNFNINARGGGKIIIPAGVTINVTGNFQLDPKTGGCVSGNNCTFEIEVLGTLIIAGNLQNNLKTLVWTGTGEVKVGDTLENSSNGCMTCGSTCPSFSAGTACVDNGVGCAGGDFCLNGFKDQEAVYTVASSQNIDKYINGLSLATVTDADGVITSAVLANGTALPPGTSLNASTGQIRVSDNTLLVAGSYPVDISTIDATGGTTTQTITLIFKADQEAVYTVAPAQITDVYINGQSLATVSDADGAIISAVLANGTSLPAGTSLDAVTGEITVADNTQLVAGNYPFDITTIDATGGTTTQIMTLVFIADQEAVYSVASAQSTDSYTNGQLLATVTDADGAITSVILANGTSLPAGTSMNAVTGEITVFDNTQLVAGSYPVDITTIDIGGGTTTQTISLVFNAPCSLSVTLNGPPALCNNTTATVQTIVSGGSGNYGYLWDTGETGSSVSKPAGTYSTIVTDLTTGCSSSANITIIQLNGPTAITATSNNASCGNPNGGISVNAVTGGIAPYIYSLDGTQFQGSPTFSSLLSGSYTVTARDINGCSVTTNILIGDILGPNNMQLQSQMATCGASNGALVVSQVTGGTIPYQYSIDGVNFQSAPIFNNLAGGAYTITVEDANGCQFSFNGAVNDDPGPTSLSSSTTPSTCGNSNASITLDTVIGGTPPYTYALDGSSFQQSTIFINIAAGSHILSARDANGCILNSSVAVSNITGPTDFSFNTIEATCGVSNGNITINSVIGGVGPNQYALNNGNFQSGLSFIGLSAGNYLVRVKDANGCEISKNAVIANKIGPTAISYITLQANCGQNNGGISIDTVLGGDIPYTYSIDGLNFQASGQFNGLSFGTYDVTVKDANGCAFSEPVFVPSDGPETMELQVANTACGLSNGNISVSSVSGGIAPYTYSLDGVSYQAISTFSNLGSGNHTVYVQDNNSCVLTEVVSLIDVPGPQNIQFNLTGATCGLSNGQFIIQSVIGGTVPYQYALDGGVYQGSGAFSGLTVGNHSVTVRDGNNCELTQSFNIIDLPGEPQATLDQLTPISCFGRADGSIVVIASSPNPPLSFSIDSGSSFQIDGVFNGLSKGTYTVLVMDNNGCTISINNIEIIEPEPLMAQSNILQMPDLGLSNGIAFLDRINGGIPPYFTTLDGRDTGQDTVFQNLSSGPHTITLEDQNQCFLSFEVILESEVPEIEIPNGFTPNGDGMNDIWELSDLSELYPNMQIQVFNRWGQMVFSSKGYSNPWNGKRHGQDLPTATYYYIIALSNDIDPLQGNVTIIR